MNGISAAAALTAVPAPASGGGAANVDNAALLPAPAGGALGGDLVLALYAMMSDANQDQCALGRSKVKGAEAQKTAEVKAYEAAVARAQEAESEQRGFFDSIGIVGLVGAAYSMPWVVFADTIMHMAHLTPDFLRDFEKNHASEIETAEKISFVSANASHVLAKDPQAFAASVALGGLLLKESGVLGDKTSDWAGVGMMAYGANSAGTKTELAGVIAADKDSAVAEEIRSSEKEYQDYLKWAAIIGMIVAAAAATVCSWGTATPAVIMIGVALSAGGFAVSETKCLDPVLGENASMWIGLGMGVAGGIISGAGMASSACQAAQVLNATSQAVSGMTQVQSGMYAVQDAAIAKESDDAYTDATEAHGHIDRLQRWIEQFVEELEDSNKAQRRVATILNETADTRDRTTMIALGARA